MKVSSAVVFSLAAVAMIAVTPNNELQAQAQGAIGPPEWAPAVRHDKSKPLRDTPGKPGISTRDDFKVKQHPPSSQGGGDDPSVQTSQMTTLSAAPGVGFDGVGEGNAQFPSYNVNMAPPDTTGEAGLTQYVQWVNASFAVFDKVTGTVLYGPVGGNTLWAGFGGDCETRNDGDPIVQYDHLADRWVMTQFSLRSGGYLQCVAVSQTEDALGSWHRYAFSYSEFPDYPKLSVWPNAYYITFNMFGPNGSSFTGGRVCAYDRARMLNGLSATQVCFQSTSFPSPLVSDLDGQTLPPAGTPNYMMNLGSNALRLWKFNPNFVTPASSTLTGPTTIPVSAFTTACWSACVPQPGTNQRLDALGDRLMYRLSYRNLGTREALMVNHSVVAGSVIGVRWYELNITGGVPSVRQQSTYAPADGHYRWMGSVGSDKMGNMAVGFTVSSAAFRPSVTFAGRDVNDALNTLSAENSLQAGLGSQTTGLSRWGDYSSMAIDPVDDCTFWYTSEYLRVNGTFNWSTRVASFKFPSCGTDPDPDPNLFLGVTPATRSVTQGQQTTFAATVTGQNGYTGNGGYSVTGLPANTTGTFSPTSYTGGNGTSTLTVTTAADTTVGSFPVTIRAADTSGTPTQSVVVTLTVNPVPVADFTIAASPASRSIKRRKSGTYAVTVTPSGGFSDTVVFSVTGCPFNTSCTFSPASVPGGGPSTLTVAVGSSAPRGTYTLTITGTSSKTRSTTVTLRVT